MRPNKEIANKLQETRQQLKKISERMEQEGNHALYSQKIPEYTLHDVMTGLISQKLILEWVLMMQHK